MRDIKRDESFKIQELINYADYKNESFDSCHNDKRYATSESDRYGRNQQSNQNFVPYQKPKQNYNHKSFNGYNRNFQSHSQNKPNQNPNIETITNNIVLTLGLRNIRNGANEPIKGQALFNNTLINYMYDSGADVTIINEKTFRLIKGHAPDTLLNGHSGGKLFSATSEIKIFGRVCLKRCLISPNEQLSNIVVLVTENIAQHECLLGRDVINRIPALKQRINSIQNVVREFSNGNKKIFKNEMQQRRKCSRFIKHSQKIYPVKPKGDFEKVVDLLKINQLHTLSEEVETHTEHSPTENHSEEVIESEDATIPEKNGIKEELVMAQEIIRN